MNRFDISDDSINNLLEALKSGKEEEMKKSFSAIVEKLSNCNYNSMMFALSYISSSLFNILSLMEQNSIVKFEIDFMSFQERVAQLETLEEIRTAFDELFDYIIRKIKSSKDNRNNVMAESAVAYIQKNYTDKNLSLNGIADMLKLSPATHR